MNKNQINPINLSREFTIDELFFSITDRKGIITACNDVFVRVSGYKSHELIGEPHNCIRHPDMPKCVFKLLWDYILSGKNIGAYVKNIASTGEYYWVYALVTPVDEGFLSIRIKPSSKFLNVVENLYKSLLEIEQSYEKDWRGGMQASGIELMNQLQKLGFSNYESFLNESLREELVSRDNLLNKIDGHQKIKNFVTLKDGKNISIDELFNNIVKLVEKKNQIQEKTKFLSDFASELELLAINSTVQASLLGNDGLPLAVIGKEISKMSQVIKSEVKSFSNSTNELVSSIDEASLSIATARLQKEMSKIFNQSLKVANLSDSAQIDQMGQKSETLIYVLDECVRNSADISNSEILNLLKTMNNFEEFIEALAKVFQVLQFSYVSGRAEMSRISREDEFKGLFDGLNNLATSANTHLKDLSETIGVIKDSIKNSVAW